MTITEKFVVLLKSAVNRKGTKKDWEIFTYIAKILRIGLIYRSAKGEYLASIGRSYEPKVVSHIISLIVGLNFALNIGLIGLSKTFAKEIEETLLEDKKLNKLQQFFPEYKDDFQYLINNLNSASYISNTYVMVLKLAGKEDADLIDYINQLGRLLDSRTITYFANKSVLKMEAKDFSNFNVMGLQYLKELTNKYSVLATFEPIPDVPKTVNKKYVQSLFENINKYGVINELQEIIKRQKHNLLEIMSNIEDVYEDFPKGIIRKKGLNMFKKYTFWHTNF